MTMNLSKSATIVQKALAEKGFDFKVVELAQTTRTALEASDAIGCHVAQIIKSIIFRIPEINQPVLVIASGINRINEKKITAELGKKIEKADAEFVKEATGFVIGGIPPVGHKRQIITLIDQDLFKYDELWAAAGTPNAVFNLKSKDLLLMTGGKIIEVI